MKLLFLRKFTASDTDYLLKNLADKYDIIIPKKYSDSELCDLIKDADVCIGNSISSKILKKGKKIRLFQNLGAGIDNLNLENFKGKDIIIGNSHTNTIYVAEYAIALMFSLIKKIHHHDRFMRSGNWFKPSGKTEDKYYLSDTILGKKIGILGYGNISKGIIKMLSGFENEILILSNHNNNKGQKSDSENRGQIKFVDLTYILSRSEILFVALPLTHKTISMLGEKEFDLINRNLYLINVSRAEIIQKSALYNSLLKEKIKGAALDVWYSDTLVKSNKRYPSKEFPFHELNNMVLSPYRAGYVGNLSPHLEGVVSNLLLFFNEGRVHTEVDLIEGY